MTANKKTNQTQTQHRNYAIVNKISRNVSDQGNESSWGTAGTSEGSFLDGRLNRLLTRDLLVDLCLGRSNVLSILVRDLCCR